MLKPVKEFVIRDSSRARGAEKAKKCAAASAIMERVVHSVKPLMPPFMRKLIGGGSRSIKTTISRRTGILPDFIIIGAQKCGTTSLYQLLVEHPCIYPASTKEVGYFDRYYSDDIKWYRAQFPSLLRKYYVKWILRQDFVTGEASTGYILIPHALKRISEVVPRAKLILMLRNPVDRAYSHYHHTVRLGKEPLSFEDAIERERERISSIWKKMLEDENYWSMDIPQYSYLSTGVYVDQIKILMSLFSREQILILKFEDFRTDPSGVFKRVLEFLNMPNWELKDYKRYNVGNYSDMDAAVRKRLVEYFKPHNERLYEYLGATLDWDK
jgi:hypothetical protein